MLGARHDPPKKRRPRNFFRFSNINRQKNHRIFSFNKTPMRELILFLTVVTVILISSCSKKTLNGTWKSIGYGQRIDITDSITTMYDIHNNGCNVNFKVPTSYLKTLIEIIKINKDSLKIKQGITEYDFIKISNKECKDQTGDKNPITNFNALWNTFNENYSSFDIRQIDWADSRNKYRKELTEQTTDKELYSIINTMLTELNDGHVSIEIPEFLDKEIQEKKDSTELLRKVILNKINAKYLSKVNSYNKGTINFGLVNDNVSYIQLNDLEQLADYRIDQSFNEEEYRNIYENKSESSSNNEKDIINGIKKYMKLIYKSIKNTSHCIIDLRFNDGGLDEAGLEFLRYFTSERKEAFNKQAKTESGFTREQKIFIEPAKKHFKGKVYVLTSHQTASAAEVFVLSSLNLPNTIRIGSNTEGIFSDILSKKLPNGWTYALSNEIYKSTKGINFEKVGIPPDYKIEYSIDDKEFYKNLLHELNNGDKAIEKALQLTRD
jgi:carboxyl-terminal processing protease